MVTFIIMNFYLLLNPRGQFIPQSWIEPENKDGLDPKRDLSSCLCHSLWNPRKEHLAFAETLAKIQCKADASLARPTQT